VPRFSVFGSAGFAGASSDFFFRVGRFFGAGASAAVSSPAVDSTSPGAE